jgi:hypothetical protein
MRIKASCSWADFEGRACPELAEDRAIQAPASYPNLKLHFIHQNLHCFIFLETKQDREELWRTLVRDLFANSDRCTSSNKQNDIADVKLFGILLRM